jgi:hypothetical protein
MIPLLTSIKLMGGDDDGIAVSAGCGGRLSLITNFNAVEESPYLTKDLVKSFIIHLEFHIDTRAHPSFLS